MIKEQFNPLLLLMVLGMALLPSYHGMAQTDDGKKIYDPDLDGRKEIAKYVNQAKKEGKHVLLQVGGNW